MGFRKLKYEGRSIREGSWAQKHKCNSLEGRLNEIMASRGLKDVRCGQSRWGCGKRLYASSTGVKMVSPECSSLVFSPHPKPQEPGDLASNCFSTTSLLCDLGEAHSLSELISPSYGVSLWHMDSPVASRS